MITELITLHPDIEDSSELEDIRERWDKDLVKFRQQLADLPADADALQRALLCLEVGDRQARLDQGIAAWTSVRPTFDEFLAAEDWEHLAQACDVLFRANQPDAVVALGHGVWVAVTYPVDPVTTVALLQHMVDSSPTDSNAAAVAATVAHYIAAIRGEGKSGDDLVDFTEQLWLLVAGNQGASGQNEFAGWVHHNGLKEPAEFLPRLSEGVDNMVAGSWWLDRDALRARIPADV